MQLWLWLRTLCKWNSVECILYLIKSVISDIEQKFCFLWESAMLCSSIITNLCSNGVVLCNTEVLLTRSMVFPCTKWFFHILWITCMYSVLFLYLKLWEWTLPVVAYTECTCGRLWWRAKFYHCLHTRVCNTMLLLRYFLFDATSWGDKSVCKQTKCIREL